MAHSDVVVTVSPSHAVELRTAEGGFGLHDRFTELGDRLVGILNGIDPDLWNPETDPELTGTYSSEDLSGKRRCKARSEEHTSELQSRFDLVCRLLLEKKKSSGRRSVGACGLVCNGRDRCPGKRAGAPGCGRHQVPMPPRVNARQNRLPAGSRRFARAP